MKRITVLLLVLTAGQAVAAEGLMDRAKQLFQPIPAAPPASQKITADSVQLGKMLYFDPRMSTSWLVSCNSCHNVGMGGVDLQETSIGHGWAKGPRNAPTVLNSVFNLAQFWDGRAPDLKEQAKGPVQAAVEMNNTPEKAVKTVNSMPEYVALFKKTFPDQRDPVTFENMAKAIADFEATLNTPDAPFDLFLKGDEKALNAEQKEGLALFMDKGCASCHNGINVGGGMYQPFGVVEKPGAEILPPGDKGRFAVTKTVSDEYVYKVPTLRNIALTPPYFHTGKVWGLKQAVGVMGQAQLGVNLSDADADKIVAFLHTLTGKQPQVEHPVLPPITAATPGPELGVMSKQGGQH